MRIDMFMAFCHASGTPERQCVNVMHDLASQTLNELIDNCRDEDLPFGRTKCRRLVRYSDRYVPERPPKVSTTPSAEFVQLAEALVRAYGPVSIVRKILSLEDNPQHKLNLMFSSDVEKVKP